MKSPLTVKENAFFFFYYTIDFIMFLFNKLINLFVALLNEIKVKFI